jgi:hypothetical protein
MKSEKRKCRICGKSLSTYNPEEICYCHQDGMLIRGNFPVSKCTSRPRNGYRNEVGFVPGDPGYTEFAFGSIIVGIIDNPSEDGKGSIYEI